MRTFVLWRSSSSPGFAGENEYKGVGIDSFSLNFSTLFFQTLFLTFSYRFTLKLRSKMKIIVFIGGPWYCSSGFRAERQLVLGSRADKYRCSGSRGRRQDTLRVLLRYCWATYHPRLTQCTMPAICNWNTLQHPPCDPKRDKAVKKKRKIGVMIRKQCYSQYLQSPSPKVQMHHSVDSASLSFLEE